MVDVEVVKEKLVMLMSKGSSWRQKKASLVRLFFQVIRDDQRSDDGLPHPCGDDYKSIFLHTDPK